MAGYLEHSRRWERHPQPARVPESHWGKGGDLHGGADPGACEACSAAAKCGPCEVHVPGRDRPSPWCAACRMSRAEETP